MLVAAVFGIVWTFVSAGFVFGVDRAGKWAEKLIPADLNTQSHTELVHLVRHLKHERDELRDWKSSALTVLSECNFQEIGRLLGLTVGQDVGPAIEPGIRRLLAEIELLKSK